MNNSNTPVSDTVSAEEALKRKILEMNTFINNIPDMAWLKDSQSRFIIANKAFGDAVGKKPEELTRYTCEVCFPLEEAKKHAEDDQRVMKSRKQTRIIEKIAGKDGDIWLETIKSPIIDENGNVTGTVGIARDITIRKKAETELEETKRKLQEQLGETERMNNMMIGRELKMAEMKQEIDELKKKISSLQAH